MVPRVAATALCTILRRSSVRQAQGSFGSSNHQPEPFGGIDQPSPTSSDSTEIMGTPVVGDRIDSTRKSGDALPAGVKGDASFPCNLSSFFIEIHDLSTSLCRQVTTSVVSLASLSIKVVSIIPKPNTLRPRMLI
jgi:hypothetical protein